MSSVGLLPYIQFITLCFLFLDIIFIYFSHLSFSQSRVGVRTECSSSECWFIYSANIIRIQLFIVHAIMCVCVGRVFLLLLQHNFKLLSFLRSFISFQILMNDWLPRCADLVDSMMDHWKRLVPMKSKDGGRAAILFRCIHSLMSRQVQSLIKRSIDHFFDALVVYKVCLRPIRCFSQSFALTFQFSSFFIKKSNLTFSNAPWFFFVSFPWEKNGEICHLLTV